MHKPIASVCNLLAAVAILAHSSHASSQFTYSNTTYDVPSWNDTATIDMIYPRNDTYAPQSLFPVVVSLGQAQVASYLQMQLQYQLFPLSSVAGVASETAKLESVFDATALSVGGQHGTYWLSGLRNTTLLDGQYRMLLTATVANCSVVPGQGINHPTEQSVDTNFRRDRSTKRSAEVYFTISRNSTKNIGTTSPDEQHTCDGNAALAFRVIDYIPVASASSGRVTIPGTEGFWPICAVLSDEAPRPEGCGANMATSASRSFNDTITAAECKQDLPVIKCPATATSASAQLQSMGWASLAACTALWLAF